MAWLISLRDLQWRRRRFGIAVVANALVLALGLLLSGVSASFDNEIERTVD
jgi:putative ABC transport system permease protein